jgi:outer membrane beta-barrel protein
MRKWLFLIILTIIIPKEGVGEEKDLYKFQWLDPDKSVYVLQNKAYQKNGTTYVNLGFVSSLTPDFHDTLGGQFRLGHYLHEEWAVEVLINQYSHSDNNTLESLRRINGVTPFMRKLNRTYGLVGVWSPFYGKINTFNKIFYFDWSFGLGIGMVEGESNINSAQNPSQEFFTDEDYAAGLFKTGLRFHINKNWHVGIEYLNTFYRAKTPGKSESMKYNNDLIFSIGFSF